jgi:transposase
MADWPRESGVTHVAMESTGVYWRPVWNILEGQFEILLVNAQHINAVPGRKTDQKDTEWIADLLQHGLLKGSFVPPTPLRELRDLTRYRVSLAQECNRIANRVQKGLEDANIKLASDALGAPGRGILCPFCRPHKKGCCTRRLSAFGRIAVSTPKINDAAQPRVVRHRTGAVSHWPADA